MKKTIVMLISVWALFSCASEEKKNEFLALQKEVMIGHDEVMPLSLKIPKVKEELLASVANLEEGDSLKIEVNGLIEKLSKASDGMYTWMDKLSVAMKLEDGGEEKLKEYSTLNEEIKEIASETEESMKEAKLYLEEHAN